MLQHVCLFLLGLVILSIAAEWLIRGAVRVARALGVSPFVVGFTVIGFGTSAPEMVVSVSAALKGSSDIALGNVVGSNIANIGLVLGIAAIVSPLAARMRLLTVEVPLVIVASLLLLFLCRDNRLSRGDGIALLVAFLGLCVYMFRSARQESSEIKEEVGKSADGHMRVWVATILMIVGLAGLIGGAHLMVTSAVQLARDLGVTEWLIGLTVVAVGTSLPEIAAGVAAAYRGQPDLVLGNIAGSNLFNILLVLGTTLTIQPIRISDSIVMNEIPVMVMFSLLLLVTVANGMIVHRWEGAILIAAYAGFITWQVTK
ncbi:MAG: calcium:sodium antiporter [Planctomycetaceae bacterium]|nr:calcium:sodium antiporter [Planctomycetaceae bacterium]